MEFMDQSLLTKLSEMDSVSGNEKDISLLLRDEYEKLADEIVYDNLGSIFAVKKSKKENASHVMVVGHMDEPGFIAKGINENGTIKVLALGNIETTSLQGSSVRLKKRNGEFISGTVLAFNEKGDTLDKNKIGIIDFGFEDEDEAKDSINFGDRIAFCRNIEFSENKKRIFSKNWDGRYAPLLGLELLKELKNVDLEFDLYVGCTVQEQVGFRGVQTAVNVVKPDLGIVLDTDKAFDYQEDSKDKIGELGKGLLINFYDTTVLPNRLLLSSLKEICKKNEIPFQYYYSMEGSDAAWINKLRIGSPTLFINVPIRNINTPSSVMDVRDYGASKQALITFLKELTPKKIQSFKEENR